MSAGTLGAFSRNRSLEPGTERQLRRGIARVREDMARSSHAAARRHGAGQAVAVETGELVRHLDEEGRALGEGAAAAGLAAVVPSCPDWTVRDLIVHVGTVHRWAASHVLEKSQVLLEAPEPPEATLRESTLLEWLRDGHQRLVAALASAEADLACATFLPAASPLSFWARRQAHETAIHRADAWQAAGLEPSYDPSFAADGIDELVVGFGGRGRADSGVARRLTVALRATDTGDEWEVVLEGGTMSTRRGAGPADCSLSGPASELYLLVWNRAEVGDTSLRLDGDEAGARAWRRAMRVTWR